MNSGEWIPRSIEGDPERVFRPGKVVLIYGARRVGKTALLRKLLDGHVGSVFFSTGEDADLAGILGSRKSETYRLFFQNYDIIAIDEAQYLSDVGRSLKMLVDLFPETSFLVTGSSSFGLSQEVSEPLTGRNLVQTLYPISLGELRSVEEPLDVYRRFESLLLYGMYPEVFAYSDVAGKIEYLTNLRNSHLFRDILMLERVKSSQKLQDIVTLLALQIGREVSLNEIATTVGLARNTVERYIDLLEKSFVIRKLPAFSRNLRKEVGKSAKYYFLDTGVRNAVINNFNRLELRNDTGALWENFVVMEMLKAHEAQQTGARFWFWRTYDQQKIDLVIETGGVVRGYEIKWNSRKTRIPKAWRDTYGPGEIVTRENLLQVLQPGA
jgi:uncharacterized protein